MADSRQQKDVPPDDTSSRKWRLLAAWIIAALVMAYTVAVLSGYVGPDQRVDAVHLVMIGVSFLVISILIRPELLDRFKTLDVKGVKIEMLERKQSQQENRLDDIALMLPLLLPETERKHLFKLDSGETGGYKGRGTLRAELRRLRSIGLIRMRPYKQIGRLKDDLVFDLGDYVELTEPGKRWIERIREIEKADSTREVG